MTSKLVPNLILSWYCLSASTFLSHVVLTKARKAGGAFEHPQALKAMAKKLLKPNNFQV